MSVNEGKNTPAHVMIDHFMSEIGPQLLVACLLRFSFVHIIENKGKYTPHLWGCQSGATRAG